MRKFIMSSKGAGLVEYGLLVGLIAVLAIVAVIKLGNTTRDAFVQASLTLSDNGLAGSGVGSVPTDGIPAFGTVPGPDALSTAYFINEELPGAADWVGFYLLSSQLAGIDVGTVVIDSAAPELVGTHYNHVGDVMYINFASLTPAQTSSYRYVCETEADGEFFNQALSSYTQYGTHGGYPFLGFGGVSADPMDGALGAASSPNPVYCEIRPV